MKKLIAVTVVCAVLFSVCAVSNVEAAEKGGAGPAVVSLFLPGVGEWMNSDFKGQYPFGECIVGSICFPFMISSVIDAAKGNEGTDLRFDFWSAPK